MRDKYQEMILDVLVDLLVEVKELRKYLEKKGEQEDANDLRHCG